MLAKLRFWKKFVHQDGSYDAGGVQGRYVYSTWPVVGIRMMRRMMEMEMLKMRRMTEMEMRKMRRMGMVKDHGGQFVACDLVMIYVTFGFVFLLF